MSCGIPDDILIPHHVADFFFIAKPDAFPWLGTSHLTLKVFLLSVQRVFAQP